MDNTYELNKHGYSFTITVKDHAYDVVEFSINKKLIDGDKVVVNSQYNNFFSNKEFKDFFEPMINDLKVRFDDADSI